MGLIEAFAPIDLFLTIFSLTYFLPIVILVRNYRRIGSIDYLIFSGLFCSIMITDIAALFWSYNPETNLFNLLTGTFHMLASLFFFLHFVHLRWEETPRIIWITGIVWYVSASLTIPINVLFPDLNQYVIFVVIYGVFLRLFVLSLGIYTYTTISPHYPTKRINTVVKVWTIFLILNIFASIVSQVIFVRSLLNPEISGLSVQMEIYLRFFQPLIILLIFFIAIRYPESMLVSHAQIIRATKLYELFGISQKPETSLSKDQLLAYISSFPPETVEALKGS